MAAALTYRTIFGLVPLLMVSMLAFRLFGDMDAAARQLQSAAYAFFNYQVDPTRPEAMAFKTALDERLFDVMRAVGGLSFEAIGAVGALLLIWAALGLLISFEDAANRIYRAPRGRGWLTRIGIYWTVLTLGPILLLVVLYAAEYWLGRAEALPARGAALRLPGRVRLARGELPRPHPPLQAPPQHPRALAARARPGALVAAGLGEASKWAFGLYVSRALPYLKLYGAIGLIPLFLFWLYLNWLIVLFGLEIAFTLQAMKGRVFERKDPRGALDSADPQWLLPVVAAIARGFADGQPVGRQALAEDLDLRLESVAELVARLEAEGLVHQVTRRGTEDVGLTLALPPDRIPLARIAELASRFTLGTRPREGAGWGALAAIHEQARAAAGRPDARGFGLASRPGTLGARLREGIPADWLSSPVARARSARG